MKSSLTPFAFDDALVRVRTDEHGNPWFVAKDVCRVLEIGNTSDAVSNLDEDEKGIANTDTPSGGQQMLTVSESGLYTLIFRSRKPEARRFRKWVTSEVLPALRRTGSYIMPGVDAATPEAVLAVKPSMRERILATAQRVANMSGVASNEEVERLFVRYCSLVTAGYTDKSVPVPDIPLLESAQRRMILRFATEACQYEQGSRINATALYTAFQNWWHGQTEASLPSQKAFGRIMRDQFPCRRKGGAYYYFNLSLHKTASA